MNPRLVGGRRFFKDLAVAAISPLLAVGGLSVVVAEGADNVPAANSLPSVDRAFLLGAALLLIAGRNMVTVADKLKELTGNKAFFQSKEQSDNIFLFHIIIIPPGWGYCELFLQKIKGDAISCAIVVIGEKTTKEALMAKMNCWDYKKCGRQQGGAKVSDLGLCPASTDTHFSGANNGKNGGRACWVISGTLCGGKVQGTYAAKSKNCLECDFYATVRKEEGPNFLSAMKLFNFSKAA